MAEDTPTAIHDLVRRAFATLQAKDLETLMQLFAEDAVVIDLHFPTPLMQGKVTIRKGFREAMSGMRSFGNTIVNYFESENGQDAAVETATHHVLKQGMERNFPQVFIFEVADEHITRLQSIRTVWTTWDHRGVFVGGAPRKQIREKVIFHNCPFWKWINVFKILS